MARYAACVAGVLALVVAGCGNQASLVRRTDEMLAHLAAMEASRAVDAPSLLAAPLVGARPNLLAAPLAEAQPSLSAAPVVGAQPSLSAAPLAGARPSGPEPPVPAVLFAPAGAADEAQPPTAAEPQAPAAAIRSLEGMTFRQIVAQDAREFPGDLCQGAKDSFWNPVNLGILLAAHGADRVVRNNWDADARRHLLKYGHTSLHETGDFGGFVSNPVTHFAVAGTWYVLSVARRDADQHDVTKTLIEALAVNGIATWTLKLAMDDDSPNGEAFGWPSGHTSSAFCFASVMHEYYGWKAGLPLYVLAAYGAASRVEDSEHDISDVVFGTVLGLVVGHSVARGRLPEVAGFTVLPYGGPAAGGVMFMKRW